MTFTPPPQSPGGQIALAVLLPLATTGFVALRFVARRIKRSSYMWDDWLVVFSLFFTFLTGVFIIIATVKGDAAAHMQFTPEGAPILDEKWTWFLKMLYGIQTTQTLAIGPCKIAVLLLYRRIFRGRIFNIVTWFLIGVAAVWTVAFLFANLFECWPISESWVNAPGLGTNPKCIHAIPMYMAQVYTDVIQDVLILIIPIPLVWKLQLPTKQKIAVCGMFLLGFITTVASCAKMIVFYMVAQALAEVPDLSWFMTPVIYWPLVEECLQIVAACLPLLRPLFPSSNQLSAHRSHKSWYDRTTYSDLNGGLATATSSQPVNRDDVEMESPTARGSDSDFTTEVKGGQEIYVHRTFDTKVSSV